MTNTYKQNTIRKCTSTRPMSGLVSGHAPQLVAVKGGVEGRDEDSCAGLSRARIAAAAGGRWQVRQGCRKRQDGQDRPSARWRSHVPRATKYCVR